MLTQALLDVTADPFRVGSAARSEFGAAVRCYPLRFSRRRAGGEVGQPRHVLYFRVASAELVQLGRVLHDAMDPRRHIAAGDFEA